MHGNGGPAGTTAPTGGLRLHVDDGPPDPVHIEEWDELAVATGAAPWSRPGWLLPWWRTMGRGGLLVFSLRDRSGDLQAVLPLERVRGGLRSPTNWHTPEFDLVTAEPAAGVELLARAMARCSSRMTVEFVSPGLAEDLAAVARDRRGRSHRRVIESSPHVPLGDGWSDHLDARMRAEVRRRARRLAEQGEVRLENHDGTSGLESLLDEGFRVEAAGWKGREGTAIASRPETATFYREVAAWAAQQGMLRLGFLRLDGRAIAFDLSVEHAGSCYLLKTGYDEEFGRWAPGKQLRLHALEDCAARGLSSYELLGDANQWKRDWAHHSRERWQAHAFPAGAAGVRSWLLHARLLPGARVARDRLGGMRVGSRRRREL